MALYVDVLEEELWTVFSVSLCAVGLQGVFQNIGSVALFHAEQWGGVKYMRLPDSP